MARARGRPTAAGPVSSIVILISPPATLSTAVVVPPLLVSPPFVLAPALFLLSPAGATGHVWVAGLRAYAGLNRGRRRDGAASSVFLAGHVVVPVLVAFAIPVYLRGLPGCRRRARDTLSYRWWWRRGRTARRRWACAS